LGTLGGNLSAATWANDAGEIVGWSTLPGEQVRHASAWKSAVISDLGALESLPCSSAAAINSSSQVVGEVDDCISIEHAALWDQGRVIDLNTFVPTSSGIVLEDADYINDRGEIIGYALLPNGDEHGYLLIPCDGDHPGIKDCDYGFVDASTAAQIRAQPSAAATENNQGPVEWRKRLDQRFIHRRNISGSRP
jgi:probable HAF family extracellular repeat protein